MFLTMRSILAFSLLPAFGTGLQFVPQATSTTIINLLHADDFNPHPTTAPSLEDLRKRQDGYLMNNIPGLIVAPDNTCGYQDGNASLALDGFCTAAKCAFALTSGRPGGDMYCCGRGSSATCTKKRTTCIGFLEISTKCQLGCNTETTIVCGSQAPFCQRGYFATIDVSALYCGPSPYSKDDAFDTTYPGQQDHSYTPVITSSSPSISPTLPVSFTTTSSVSGVTPSSTSSPRKPPIGPIVGGAIGGVAVISLVIVAIILLLRKRRRSASGDSQPPPFVQDQPAVAQGYNPYSAPPPEKSAPLSQAAYVPPTYSNMSSPVQKYSPTSTAASPLQYQEQQFSPPQSGRVLPQELNSNPTSPRPESALSNSPVPVYVPYQPSVSERHEVQ